MGEYLYRVETSSGEVYTHYDRNKSFEYYKRNDGVKITKLTKDLFPEITIIVDRPNVDINDIGGNDILAKTPANVRKSIQKYDKQHTVQFKIKLNLNTDKAIIDKLNSLENKQGYLKDLIKKDLNIQ